MNRLYTGFTAIMAILAMSFTFVKFPHSAVTNFKTTEGCYQQVTVSYTSPGGTVSVTLTAPDAIILGTPPFASPVQSNPTVVKISRSKFTGQTTDIALPLPYRVSGVSGSLNPATDCPSPYQRFCCFAVSFYNGGGTQEWYITGCSFRSN